MNNYTSYLHKYSSFFFIFLCHNFNNYKIATNAPSALTPEQSAIWHIEGSDTVMLPLPEYKGKELDIRIAFPENDTKCTFEWNSSEGILTVKMTEEMARIFEIC